MKKTDSEKVLDEIRKTLIQANRQSRKKQVVSHDRMVSLSKLANAYTKLLIATSGGKEAKPARDPLEYGSPSFYDELSE